MKKFNWTIHYVSQSGCDICNDNSNAPYYYDLPCFANIHTHGLDKYNHRELCICIDIGHERVSNILNSIAYSIAYDNLVLEEGICDCILQGYSTKIISFENDPTLYLILPDVNGNFPGEEGCEEIINRQEEYAKYISDNKEYV